MFTVYINTTIGIDIATLHTQAVETVMFFFKKWKNVLYELKLKDKKNQWEILAMFCWQLNHCSIERQFWLSPCVHPGWLASFTAYI